nr:NADH-quinone oxidoreductase subunit J [uncultured Holophaga sp.]
MFLIFALITLGGALAMFRSRNLVVAGLCLVLTFLGVAGLYLMMANPVAAALQVIVYAGAIVVLLLFVIMLLEHHAEEPADHTRPIHRWISALAVAIVGAAACWAVLRSPALHTLGSAPLKGPVDLKLVGATLFQDHLVSFEAAGLLLLAAMVGAVALVKKEL